MKCVFPYLSCASDRLRQISLAAGPIRSTFQIWLVTRHVSMQFLRSFLGRRFAGKPVEDSEITDDFSGCLARGISWLNPWASPTYPGCRYDDIILKRPFSHYTRHLCKGRVRIGGMVSRGANGDWQNQLPIHLSRITLRWANTKKWGRGSGGQFHTTHCILSTSASSWCLCSHECGNGL